MRLSLIAASVCLALGACGGGETSTQIERRAQEQASLQAVQQVGMPGITKYAEKRMMKTILELRDKEVATFTYIMDLNGHLHLLCHSVGYGLPYATQYTNPQMDAYYNTSSTAHITLPQADPNGLYSPASADGTWVMCLNPDTKLSTPMYIEPKIVVSTFALPTVQ